MSSCFSDVEIFVPRSLVILSNLDSLDSSSDVEDNARVDCDALPGC
jgi:hypothetical protein